MHLFWLSPCFLHADCLESFHGHAGGDERTQAGQLSGHVFLVPLLVQSTGPPLVGLHFLFFLSFLFFLFFFSFLFFLSFLSAPLPDAPPKAGPPSFGS